MNIFSSIILGLVQGVAEFLPISSSGHLSLFQHFFGLANPEETLFFDVLLHLGTLIAVFIYYWRDILDLILEFFYLVGCLTSKKRRAEVGRLSPSGRMILMIIIATLPLFVVLPIKDRVEDLYGNTVFIGGALIVTGFLLFLSDRMGRGKKTARSATMLDALLVGVGQAVAVVPGLSRSGTSISMGLMRGFRRSFAVRFSFLMSIPAVLGANILSIGEAVQEGIELSEIPIYLVGTAVAAVAGYFAIRMVNNLANRGKFGTFAYYCWGVGAAAIITSLILPLLT